MGGIRVTATSGRDTQTSRYTYGDIYQTGGGGLLEVTEQEGKEGLVLVDWKDFSEEISKI